MSEANLDRVREDLAVMKQALGVRPPFEDGHVWVCLALAGVGIVVVALTLFTSIATLPVTQGSVAHLTYIALLVLPVLLVFAGVGMVANRQKALAPLLWREFRVSLFVAIIAVPLYIGFLIWAVWSGISPGAITATTLFLTGLFSLMGALSESRHRYILGWAIATLLAGACSPLGTYSSAGILVGGWLFLGGLLTAGLMAWQLRKGGGYNAHRL
jgi:hypothetical protein